MAKLTALQVKNAVPGTYVDGAGLLLRVKPTGARSWVLRVQVAGRRRDIGLGSTSDLTLSEAREKAAALRKLARQGKDPIAERDKGKADLVTFMEAAKQAHHELAKGWDDKTSLAFLNALETHAFPKLGRKFVRDIGTPEVVAALEPIWTSKPTKG